MKSYFAGCATICIIVVIFGFFVKPDSKSVVKIYPENNLRTSPEQSLLIQVDNKDKDKGIGPVNEVPLGPVDKDMAAQGKSLFNSKCVLCHDLKQNKIGPALGNITKERTPEFIMNLLLNTNQMQKEDPVIKELIKKYRVLMTPPNLSKEQARAVVEYLRSVAK